MRSLKNLFKLILKYFGYEVIKPKIISKREIYNAHYFDNCFKCIKGDTLTDAILQGKIWDQQIYEILNNLSNSPGTIIEIGANIGTSILPLTAKFPHLSFKLFEPVPFFYSLLQENHKTFNKKNNVSIYNLAFASTEDEEIEIIVGLGTAGKSQLVTYQMNDQSLKIKGKTIDSYFNSEKVILIKIDVDGHELGILRGGINILKQQHPLLFIEFAPKLMIDIHINPLEVTNFLKDLGYNQITIWDVDSTYIKTTSDWNEVVEIGTNAPHYIDILVSRIP